MPQMMPLNWLLIPLLMMILLLMILVNFSYIMNLIPNYHSIVFMKYKKNWLW
uniref:ATP synthase subunit 8 n=1 Tax=Achelia bituberculata TaxID=262805 RepID=A7E1P7_ACHBT|nr:ATP synthase subunit 8 [Achelia bituberculata]